MAVLQSVHKIMYFFSNLVKDTFFCIQYFLCHFISSTWSTLTACLPSSLNLLKNPMIDRFVLALVRLQPSFNSIVVCYRAEHFTLFLFIILIVCEMNFR